MRPRFCCCFIHNIKIGCSLILFNTCFSPANKRAAKDKILVVVVSSSRATELSPDSFPPSIFSVGMAQTQDEFERWENSMWEMVRLHSHSRSSDIGGNDVCVICLDDMVIEKKKLFCGHMFHSYCIQEWAKKNSNCPICR